MYDEVRIMVYCAQCDRELTEEGASIFANRPFCINRIRGMKSCYEQCVKDNPLCQRGSSCEKIEPEGLQELAQDHVLAQERRGREIGLACIELS